MKYNEREKEKDNFPTSIPDRTSASTPTTPTPRQYGIGRQVIRGIGRDFQYHFEDLGTGPRGEGEWDVVSLVRTGINARITARLEIGRCRKRFCL
ncbi:hypothetical protein BYT27DRAFT_6900647 [Phlegmacium glaucopus]|nr:hypothetical protein BYT27DRAFT_6900647 [Phlegmacium glaucopus]